MGFKSIIVAVLMVAIFFIAIVNFNVNFIEQNGGNITLKDNSAINSTINNITAPLENISSVYGNQSDILAGSSQTTEFTSIPEAISGVWTVLIQAPQIIYNIVFNLIFAELFGGDVDFSIIFLTIGAIVILIFTLRALHNLRTGEP